MLPADARILIVRTSALGDIVHALPVLSALRRHRPESTIGWVVEAPFASLLEEHPDVDEVIVASTKRWRQRPLSSATLGGARDFASRVADFSADVALDLMGNHKSATIVALSQADRRIGLGRRHRREPSSALWLNEGCEPLGPHAVDHALSVLAPLGLPHEVADFAGDRIFPEARPGAAAPTDAAILPGAGWDNKRYPPAWWGRVAVHLGEAGISSRLLPGPGEEPLAEEAVAASEGHARLVAPGGLTSLAATLRGARIVLGGDTGPVHLAHALGVPVLCLMGPTDPERNGPYRGLHRTLWKRLPCSFCHKRFDEPKACLLELPPALVAERALDLAGSKPADG